MRQNVGLSAFIVAAIVFAIRSGTPGPQPGLSARGQSGTAANQNTPQPEILEGPWLATRFFFHSTGNPAPPMVLGGPIDSVRTCVASSGDCRATLARYFGVSVPNQIHVMVATVPDPLHSRLSLGTDSSIQAIEDAAQASNWIFAAEWLPWIDAANPEEKDPEKRRQERNDIRLQEKQPGILVFRQRSRAYETSFRPDVLLIFLAGETPTAGVNAPQFQLARAYMRAIHEPADTEKVLILGPTFSGSFYSLVKLLEDDRTQGPVPAYRVRSGTVTGADDGNIFQNVQGVDFRGSTASTLDQDRYFWSTLVELGIDPADAALLIEDESAFGKGAAEVTGRTSALTKAIRVFLFPRDISHLRNVYRDAATASKAGNSPPSDIEFSIKDPETGEDSIPIFSSSQSPLSQYGVVNNIAKTIQREGVRLVRVEATNVLDMLFLADVLKRQCPDTRLLLDYTDVLLVQAAQSEPLTGTLVLASYPSFFASNEWMGGVQTKRPVVFPDANSEGVYNATVLLLNEDDSVASKILADYHWLGSDLNHPPTWLLTLDRQGFLPVNVLSHNKDEEKNETWFQKVPPPAGGALPRLPEPPRSWSFVSSALALGCLALAGWIVWISSLPACEMDARFSFLQIGSESGWRRFHIFALLVALLLMELSISIPGLRADLPSGFIWLLAGSGAAVLFATGCVLANLRSDRNAKRMVWLGAAGAVACLALWIASCVFPHDRGMFFAFRARELRFGSSPTWPIVTSLGAMALFAFVHVTRLYLDACQKPGVAIEGLPPTLKDRVRKAWENFNGAVESPFGIQRQNLKAMIPYALAGAVVGILFRVHRMTWSIDGLSYNVLALFLQLLLVVLLLLTCVHIRLLWRSLQSFLASLSMLPFARSFRPTDRSGADSPIWVRRLNLRSIDVRVQAMYVLHNMTILVPDALGLDPSHATYLLGLKTMTEYYGQRIQELLKVDRRSREDTLYLTKAMRFASELIAEETLEFLRDFWKAKPLVGPEIAENPGAGAESVAKQPTAPSPLDELAGLAQRFVTLHYSSFILYGVRQIQNLLLFLSSGFVLLMISLNCYTIQAPQSIGRLLMILFVILGAATFSCLAGLERDTLLSRISGSDPGKFNSGFYLKLASYGGLPVLSVLASEFPSISNFLLSWVEPTLEAFK
jgi:hypothetical protein